ncbi:hypothetical protein [Mycobacterium sp.]|uniref:hypothetical protein n=1 Tax=Mycobacterium sp. TaxID=1785 RepID=UPI003D0F1443
MAEMVNINPDKLIQAAATVADHLVNAAVPPAGALPPALAPSPADLAAAGVDEILQKKIAAAAVGLANKGPTFSGLAAGASTGLQTRDADNAAHIAAVKDDNAEGSCRG